MNSNGHEYVDLGLSSGTMWATCNVGADKPEEDGLLFQFGRTDGYKYGNKNHKFHIPDENEITNGAAYVNGQILSLDDDAAHVNMGGDWIMPTKADLQELYDNTTRHIMTINGKEGMLFTSNINGKSIFIVFAGGWSYFDGKFYNSNFCGYLKSSEFASNDYNCAWYLGFYSDGDCCIYDGNLFDSYSVRGVLK